MKGKSPIILLQETHSQPADERTWPGLLGGGTMLFSHGDSNARGVATFINKNINFQIDYTYRDGDGRILITVLDLNGKKVCISNIYAPNLSSSLNDRLAHEEFFKHILEKLNEIKTLYNISNVIIGGDFNLIRDKYYDAYGGNPTIYHKSIEIIVDALKYAQEAKKKVIIGQEACRTIICRPICPMLKTILLDFLPEILLALLN